MINQSSRRPRWGHLPRATPLAPDDAGLRAIMAELERHPDPGLFEELAAVDPSASGRFRVLAARQSGIRAEAEALRTVLGEGGVASRHQVRRLSSRLQALARAENHALLDVYMRDTGGEC